MILSLVTGVEKSHTVQESPSPANWDDGWEVRRAWSSGCGQISITTIIIHNRISTLEVRVQAGKNLEMLQQQKTKTATWKVGKTMAGECLMHLKRTQHNHHHHLTKKSHLLQAVEPTSLTPSQRQPLHTARKLNPPGTRLMILASPPAAAPPQETSGHLHL